jgi:CheY-like chemotaxis protein
VQGIAYQFDSLDAFAGALDSSGEEQDLALPCNDGVRDGEWLLVTVAIGEEATSVAGRVRDRGTELRLTFEERDWNRLQRFARGESSPSIPPPSMGQLPEAVWAPEGSTALVIDADLTVLGLVQAVLDACGVDTDVAHGAEEALDRLRSERFDLIVVEPALDWMSGLELCRRVRADPRLSQVPLLVVSSHTSPRDLQEALSAGADDFVSKPFRALELRARAVGLIRRARAFAAASA